MIFNTKKKKDNVYGYDVIEVIAFNYDGKGSALTFADGDLMSFAQVDIETIMMGDGGDGTTHYKLDKDSLQASKALIRSSS
jgi:hypothetical protein